MALRPERTRARKTRQLKADGEAPYFSEVRGFSTSGDLARSGPRPSAGPGQGLVAKGTDRASNALLRQPSPQQLVREAEQKYLEAVSILSRDIRQRRSHLDLLVLARFDNALADIDRTIAETRRAVRQNRGDPIALQYMLAAYSKKVDALREMATD